MVSATDPAAVIATFKRLAVPRALSTMVDGGKPAQRRDGSGALRHRGRCRLRAGQPDPGGRVVRRDVVVSVAIGLATGFVAAKVIGSVGDHLIELTITVVLAYGAYLLADQLGLSGVIATVTAGIVLGDLGPARQRAQDGTDPIDTVWEFIAYLLTAVVFLLVGLAIPPARCSIRWARSPGASSRSWSAARSSCTSILGGSSRLAVRPGLAERIPMPWLHVLFWAGLRGAVAWRWPCHCPPTSRSAALLQEVTFGIILFTLLIQGTTIGWVVDHTVRRDAATGEARLDLASSVEPATVGVVAFGRSASTGRAQDPVQLAAVVPADRRPVEPLDVLDVVAGDLAERPAGIATEVEDACPTGDRAAGRPRRAPRPCASIRRRCCPGSNGPVVQSRDTTSGGGVGGVAGADGRERRGVAPPVAGAPVGPAQPRFRQLSPGRRPLETPDRRSSPTPR